MSTDVFPVPLKPMPIITEPFSRVGPLTPPSSDGHRYILTLIDFATGFMEALPLKEIDSISVAEALMVIFFFSLGLASLEKSSRIEERSSRHNLWVNYTNC